MLGKFTPKKPVIITETYLINVLEEEQKRLTNNIQTCFT